MNYLKKSEKPLFDITDRCFNIKAWYLENDEANNIKGDSIVIITKNEEKYREFLYPSYKIYNIAAHAKDIIDGEINNSVEGYEIAGSDGLGGCVAPREIT